VEFDEREGRVQQRDVVVRQVGRETDRQEKQRVSSGEPIAYDSRTVTVLNLGKLLQ
jgi:hypothetical protein